MRMRDIRLLQLADLGGHTIWPSQHKFCYQSRRKRAVGNRQIGNVCGHVIVLNVVGSTWLCSTCQRSIVAAPLMRTRTPRIWTGASTANSSPRLAERILGNGGTINRAGH